VGETGGGSPRADDAPADELRGFLHLRKIHLATGESIFGIHIAFIRSLKGGFFLRKKPLERVLSVYNNSENAITR
jgi:hypothetical protein